MILSNGKIIQQQTSLKKVLKILIFCLVFCSFFTKERFLSGICSRKCFRKINGFNEEDFMTNCGLFGKNSEKCFVGQSCVANVYNDQENCKN